MRFGKAQSRAVTLSSVVVDKPREVGIAVVGARPRQQQRESETVAVGLFVVLFLSPQHTQWPVSFAQLTVPTHESGAAKTRYTESKAHR